MAFSDISSKAKTRIGFFVQMSLYDLDSSTAETLYFADGAWGATKAVDNASRQWRGRIRDWTIHKRDQTPGVSTWTHPRASFTMMVGDSSDWLLAYMTDNWLWEGRDATVWMVDMDQDKGQGALAQVIGKITGGPQDLHLHSEFSVEVLGNHPGITLLNARLDAPTKERTGFVQPAAMSANDMVKTCGGIGAADLQVDLSGGLSAAASAYRPGRCFTIGTEVVRIGGITVAGVTKRLSALTRGYAGTSAQIHAATQSAVVYKVGPNAKLSPSGTAQTLLPYLFGEQASHRGLVIECRALAYAGALNDWTAGTIEAWFCTHKVTGGGTAWQQRVSGGDTVIKTTATPLVYNDLDSPLNSPVHPHETPNLVVAGSYLGTYDKTDFDNNEFVPDQDRMWVRHSGARDGGNNVLDTPDGIFQYLLSNSNFSFGFTLGDEVYTGRIDGGNNNGDWADEYGATDLYWGEIQGEVPRVGTKEPPLLMSVLQELADMVNSDVFVRAGKLYPTRRTLGSRASDVTVTADKLYGGDLPRRLLDPKKIYCNELRASTAGAVWSQPVTSPDSLPPSETPFTIRLEDTTEIGLRGRIVGKAVRKYWWSRMSDGWRQGSDTEDSTLHLGFWRGAHSEMLRHRSQRQIYMECDLPARFAWLEQGMGLTYALSPYTTRQGQIRDIKISRKFGSDKGIKVTARSWHVEFDA